MTEIVLIVHNIRSAHNVGSLMRSADSFGVSSIIFSGYSPYPQLPHDSRLPHIARKMNALIAKTALGAEAYVPFSYEENVTVLLKRLKKEGYTIVALEQDSSSIPLPTYKSADKIALIIGEEVNGITLDLLTLCDTIVEIPMHGKKESLNVAVATGITLYQLRLPR